MYNPCIRGWITCYGHFYKMQLRPTLKRIDAYVIRWVRRKFKRMRHHTKMFGDSLGRPFRATPAIRSASASTAESPRPSTSAIPTFRCTK